MNCTERNRIVPLSLGNSNTHTSFSQNDCTHGSEHFQNKGRGIWFCKRQMVTSRREIKTRMDDPDCASHFCWTDMKHTSNDLKQ